MKRKFFTFITALALCAGIAGGGAPAFAATMAERHSDTVIGSRFEYREATGNPERATDVGLISGTMTATKRLGENSAVSFSGGGMRYRFPSEGGYFATGGGISFSYRGDIAGWETSYFRQNASGQVPSRESYTIHSLIKMLPNMRLGLSYGRENRINNVEAVKSDLGDHYLNASLSYAVNPFLSFACDFKKADVSDGNTYQVQGLQSRLTFSQTPSFYALFRLERQMYATASSRYYSPADYASFSGTLAYKRDLRLPGVKGMSFELAVKAAGDSNSDVSFHPQAALNVDINKSVSVNASYAQTFAPDYKDSNVSVSFAWHP